MSQSTFFLDDDEVGASLISDYSFPHGFGVQPLSSHAPDSSFKRACSYALEELNSNRFLSVYIEEFRAGGYSDYSFPELSIEDSVLTYGTEIAKVDSFALNGFAYCISSETDSLYNTANLAGYGSISALKKSPMKNGNTWFALGTYRSSKYNPYASWVKSKNEAVKELSRAIRMKISSSTIGDEIRSEEIAYFKTNLIFKDITVYRRFISKDQFLTIIAVDENNILEY